MNDIQRYQRTKQAETKVIGTQPLSLSGIRNRQIVRKAKSISASFDHSLSEEFVILPCGRRYRLPRAKCNRYKFSCVLSAVNALNQLYALLTAVL